MFIKNIWIFLELEIKCDWNKDKLKIYSYSIFLCRYFLNYYKQYLIYLEQKH